MQKNLNGKRFGKQIQKGFAGTQKISKKIDGRLQPYQNRPLDLDI